MGFVKSRQGQQFLVVLGPVIAGCQSQHQQRVPVSQEQFGGAGSVPDLPQVRGRQPGGTATLQRAGETRLAVCLLFLGCARVDQKREHRCDSRCWAADDLK